LEVETMAKMALRCTRCSKIDDSHQFESADEAQGSLEHWACSRCAWTDWELVDADKVDQQVEVSAPTS